MSVFGWKISSDYNMFFKIRFAMNKISIGKELPGWWSSREFAFYLLEPVLL